MCDDYIKLHKQKKFMVRQSKQKHGWLLSYLNNSCFFKKKLVLSSISLTNKNLFILNGHGWHVTLEAIKQTQAFGLNIITLPSHMNHAFQPLDVACFKPFKTTFKKERNVTMVNNNNTKLDKTRYPWLVG
jgi:hypothetical protein